MPAPFRTTRRIEFGDTDMAGIVHFANFFRFMEAAETEFLRSKGFSVAWQRDGQRLGFPRVSVSCDYLKPARFEDVLTVEVFVEKVGVKSATYRFEFGKDGEGIAVGRITSVLCRESAQHGFESIPIPAEIRKLLLDE